MLLHHVMGELEGVRGAWGYPQGGMGAVSGAIAKAALAAGADVFTNQEAGTVRGSQTGLWMTCSIFSLTILLKGNVSRDEYFLKVYNHK